MAASVTLAEEMRKGIIMERLFGVSHSPWVSYKVLICTTSEGSGKVTLLYYYATTFDEEVNSIWPQPGFKLGKLLFLGMRYCNIASLVFDYPFNTSHHGKISVNACQTFYEASWNGSIATNQYFALLEGVSHKARYTPASIPLDTIIDPRFPQIATCWLCLYALLEAKQSLLWILVALFAIFWVPITVFGYIYMKSEKYIPQVPIDAQFGYPCSFTLDGAKPILNSVAAYLVAIRAFLLILATAFVLYRHYHYRKFNNLLSVIQREGGMYLFAQVVMELVAGLKGTKHIKIPDPYGIVSIIRVSLLPIFADRLLLKMLHRDDSQTTAVISTMMFDRRLPDSGVTTDGEMTIPIHEKQ
ncbi:hypothetical protein NMY22_g14 [Coprinellus aureogranulatus]|nr:hypothetical protein NMY22_g14 [Coprinellus aureogranulatus]